MAKLSVSAFPEHIQARHNDVLITSDDGNSRNQPANTPRILGLFGAGSTVSNSRKPETQSSPRLGSKDDELDVFNSPGTHVSTPTVPSSPTFQFLPPREYDQTIDLDEQGRTPWAQINSRRPPPTFARKTTPSPIRLGASSVSNRLEIGTPTRALPYPTHVSSKSTPPLPHSAHQWSAAEPSSSAAIASRPLPIVPNPSELFKPAPASLPSSTGSLLSLQPTGLPSRSASAIPINSLPVPPNYSNNNISGPLRQPNSASRTASPPSTASPITPPSSKVLITQPHRGHKANSTSVSMRYQPLFVDPSSPVSASLNQSNDSNIAAPSAIRPLPRLPPSLSNVLNFGLPTSLVAANNTNSHVPFKRPRTSPGSFSGFSGLSSTGSSSAIPSSWAARPSTSRQSSPPSNNANLRNPTVHHRRPPALKMPRARSWSRTRREKSFDSYTRFSSRSPPNSAGLTTSFAQSGGGSKSLSVGRYGSQVLTGARPFGKRSNAIPTILGRQHERRDSLPARSRAGQSGDMNSGYVLGQKGNHQVASPTVFSLTGSTSVRHVRPHSPPSGPVSRTKFVKATSPTHSPNDQFTSSSCPKSSPIASRPYSSIWDNSSTESLHIHPILNDESRGVSTSTLESPLEFFVDGPETDVASVNRSPSPIRYALPPSNGDSSEWNSTDGETSDDELGGVSSSTSNSRAWQGVRRRTQLRSYRMEHRPQILDHLAQELEGTDFPTGEVGDITVRDLPKPARALPVPPKSSFKESKKKEKWSFGDFTSLSSPSAPGTRASTPERKGRSRQPRRLAEAVSLALGSGSRNAVDSHSRSGRGSISRPQPTLFSGLPASVLHAQELQGGGGGGGGPTDDYDVLDIRVPSKESKKEPRTNPRSLSPPLDFRIHKSQSTVRADPDSPYTPLSATRSADAQGSSRESYASESSQSGVFWVTKEGKQSGLRDASVVESRIVFRSPSDDDLDPDDVPFMWLSRDRPLDSPPFIPSRQHADNTPSERSSQEVFPTINPLFGTVGYVPLSPLSASAVSKKRGDGGRKPRTTSGPSRFNVTESHSMIRKLSTVEITKPGLESTGDVPSMKVSDDDDIYCEEEPKQKTNVDDEHSEVVVIKSRRVGRHWEESREAQVVDVIPKLRSLKTSR